MDVVFSTKSKTQNRFSIGNLEGFGRVFFDKGVLVTQDKELIRSLINNPLKKRGEYHLVTSEELVAKYLEGDEPDVLTREIVDKIKRQGIVELGEVVNAHSKEPTLIKEEVIGYPITNEIQRIINFYTITPTKEEVVQKAIEDDAIIEAPKPKRGRPKQTN